MSDLAKAANELLGMPVVVTDSAFIVRAKYPDSPLGDEQWDANVLNRQIEPRFVNTFTADDHLARHDQAGKTILIDWGHYESAPRLSAVIKSEGAVLGYFAALADGVDVEPWHFEAADAIASAFMVLMDGGTLAYRNQAGMQSALLYSLLDLSLDSAEALSMLPKDFREQNVPPYLLFCVRPRNPHNVALEAYLGSELVKYFEHAVYTVHQGDLFILASEVPGDAHGSVRSELLAEQLRKQGLICGVSRLFDDFGEMGLRKWEACAALEVGIRLALDDPLVHYVDHIVEIVCQIIDSSMPEGSLEDRALARLRKHDGDNGTEYLKTLEVYLRMGFDKKRASEALHVHRNTLQYRLDRIREMCQTEVSGLLYGLYFAVEDYRARVSDGRFASKDQRAHTRRRRPRR